MIPPPRQEGEAERLLALHALNLLDTNRHEQLDRVTRMAQRMFGVPVALVTLVDADRQWFLSAYGTTQTETPRDVSFCGHAIVRSDVMVVTDARQDERFADNPLVLDDPEVRFYAGAPLTVSGKHRVGTLCLIDNRPRVFSPDEVETLRDLAGIVEDEIATLAMATQDHLTGVLNRRGVAMFGGRVSSLCRRHGLPSALVYIDLDRFKAINDAHGHEAGDAVLVELARALRETFRESDVVGRLGGDEFCLLLPGTGPEAEARVRQRCADAIAQVRARVACAAVLDASVGIAWRSADEDIAIDAWLSAADKAMYADKKRQGRVPSP